MIASVQKAPRLTQDVANRIVSEIYAIEGSATPLPSERDQNFLIKIQKPDREGGCNNEQFVLKIANSEESLEFLELQNQMMQFLGARQIDLEFPRIVPTRTGDNIARITDEDGRRHFVRLLTWIEGVCFAEVQPHGRKLLASLGRRWRKWMRRWSNSLIRRRAATFIGTCAVPRGRRNSSDSCLIIGVN